MRRAEASDVSLPLLLPIFPIDFARLNTVVIHIEFELNVVCLKVFDSWRFTKRDIDADASGRPLK